MWPPSALFREANTAAWRGDWPGYFTASDGVVAGFVGADANDVLQIGDE